MPKILRVLQTFFPGAVPREFDNQQGIETVTFGFAPDNRATGLLNASLAAQSLLWPVVAKTDPTRPGFKCQGWGPYVDPTAPYNPDYPFPYGLGVLRQTDTGYKPSVLVVADTDPVRLIEPSLPRWIEDLLGYAMGLDDPDEANPDPGLGLLATDVRKYFGAAGRDWFHVVTSVGVGVNLGSILGCQTDVKASDLQYGLNRVAVVAIETIK